MRFEKSFKSYSNDQWLLCMLLPNFWSYFWKKFKKKPKIAKQTIETQKICSWRICVVFNVFSKKFKIQKEKK
jgi:hypothetical protein